MHSDTATDAAKIGKATAVSGKKADYHLAIDLWHAKHSSRTVFCFVQFGGIQLDHMPRLYLATPAEVAARLRESAKGRGDSILHEHHRWAANAHGAGTTDAIPDSWKFSESRIHELIAHSEAGLEVKETR